MKTIKTTCLLQGGSSCRGRRAGPARGGRGFAAAGRTGCGGQCGAGGLLLLCFPQRPQRNRSLPRFLLYRCLFENTALQYSHKLALATLGLVAASGNTYQSDALYWVEGEAGREDSIADAYQKLGFANAVYAGYQCSLNTPVDTAGCAFAQKTLVQDGQRTTIIAAMLRGVGYGAEWASNLHVGEGGGHYGFVTAAEHFF